MTDPFDNEKKEQNDQPDLTPPHQEQGHSETPEPKGYTADPQAISGEMPEAPLEETLQSPSQQPTYPTAPPSLPPSPQPRMGPPPPGFPPQAPPPGYGPPQAQPPVYGQQQQYPYQPQQMPPFAPPTRSRNRWIPLVAGLVIVTIMLVMGAIALLVGGSGSQSSSSGGFGGFSIMGGHKVAVLEVEGVIGEGANYPANTKVLVNQVKSWTENENIKAMVIRVNSPGGAVSATQDLYKAVLDFKKPVDENSRPRPVVISMGDIAASGGYYTAMAGDVIYANSGTLTGSIGVIMSFYNYQELQDMIGIKSLAVKSGEFKDIGSGSRPMTEREKVLLQETIDDVYTQFFESVVEGRRDRVGELLNATNSTAATDEEIRHSLAQYCDGRIFSGSQAYSYGMVDELGTLDDAILKATTLAKISSDSTVVRGPIKPTGLFSSLGSMANKMETFPNSLNGTARFEYRFEGL